jgi:hypothetical protein
MATLTAEEFTQSVRCLAEDLGLQRLRDKLVQMHGLVTRRRMGTAEALADQLYMLTGGLRLQVPASMALQSLWSERISERLGEEGEKDLGELADKINACLGEHDEIQADKEGELDELLRDYEQRLATKVGAERARLDMLLKAVPAVATRLRALPPVEPATATAEES